MPPPAPNPGRSWGWIITSIILALLLCLAGLVILRQFAVQRSMGVSHNFKTVGAREVGPKLEECILDEGTSRNKIAVITVDGIITSHSADEAGNNMVDVIKAQLERAADDNRVKAVILKVDSPGGEVMASDEINKAIASFEAGELDERDISGKIGVNRSSVRWVV